jgi:hypothetical protein
MTCTTTSIPIDTKTPILVSHLFKLYYSILNESFMRNLLSNAFKVCVFVLSVLFSGQAFAQTPATVQQSHLTCTPAQAHCTSKDLAVVSLYVDLPPCTPCNGSTVTAPLIMVIHNGTKSLRAAFALWGTLSSGSIGGVSGNIFICVGAITVKSDDVTIYGTGNQGFVVGNITFSCGQSLSLTNTLMAWTDASGTTTDRCATFAAATNCADIEPKCGEPGSITISQPLSATSSQTTSCDNSATGSVTVTVPAGAGTLPYTFRIDNNVIGTTSTSQLTVTKSPLGGGSHTWSVTDGAGCSATGTQTVTTQVCCTIPQVTDDPDNFAACDVNPTSATFTATATGTPTPTVQWQISTTSGGSTFTPVSGSNFSGGTTTTLTVNNIHGLNGYRVRAVFTSGTCTPTNSNYATITLYPVPPPPNAVAQPITDPCNVSTYCVKVDNVVADATYTIRDAGGNTFDASVTITPSVSVHTTTTADVTFCGIPAGTGFIVNVVSDHNCAPTNAPLPCGTARTKKANTTTTTIEIGDAQTSVKAYPNPFSDRVKFLVTSGTAGRGSLEVYNMMGQKIKTVYQGFIAAGTQTFELSMPMQQIANLVYVLRVGDKKMSGKLLQINQ